VAKNHGKEGIDAQEDPRVGKKILEAIEILCVNVFRESEIENSFLNGAC